MTSLSEQLYNSFKSKFIVTDNNCSNIKLPHGLRDFINSSPSYLLDNWGPMMKATAEYFQTLHKNFMINEILYLSTISEAIRLGNGTHVPYFDYSPVEEFTYIQDPLVTSTPLTKVITSFADEEIYNSDSKETTKIAIVLNRLSKISELKQGEDEYV